MSPSNQDLGAWFLTPAGQYLLAWERAQFEETVADIFGYHALQLGVTALDTLKTSRMPHRWLAAGERQWRTTQPAGHAADGSTNRPADPVGHSQVESQNQDHVPEHLAGASDTSVIEGAAGPATRRVVLYSDFSALPFQAASLDLVVLAHALELNADPHATLREVERVLMPEGRVVISGLNPASLWAMRQRQAHGVRHLGVGRLFLPEEGDFIGYRRLRDYSFRVAQLPCSVGPNWGDEYGSAR